MYSSLTRQPCAMVVAVGFAALMVFSVGQNVAHAQGPASPPAAAGPSPIGPMSPPPMRGQPPIGELQAIDALERKVIGVGGGVTNLMLHEFGTAKMRLMEGRLKPEESARLVRELEEKVNKAV